MANLRNKEDLQSVGGGDVFAPPADLLVIAEADPTHPHHHEHMARIRRDKPEMMALLASLEAHGWRKSVTIAVYRDGDRFVVSEGRRRLVCVRIENERRKREKDPRGPIRPRVVLDDDPALTTALANEMREGDPPMVRARRFVELRETMGAAKAAAAIGETLADANRLALILATPNAALQAAVNGGEMPIDVAARAAKNGTQAVGRVLADSRDPETGKVEPKRAREALKANHTPRARGMNRDEIATLAAIVKREPTWTGAEVAQLLLATTGAEVRLTEDAAAALSKASEKARADRKAKRGEA